MDRREVLRQMRRLKLPADAYVVVGGAAMAVRGIRETEDIDLVVTPSLFADLERAGWRRKRRPNGKPGLRRDQLEAYLDVNTESFQRTTAWLLEHAEIVEGVPLADLESLVGFKRSYGRAKDIADLKLLRMYVGEEGKVLPAAQQPDAADRDR